MKITVAAKSAFSQKTTAIVVPVFENEPITKSSALKNFVRHLNTKEFKGSEKQITILHTLGQLAASHIVLMGLGKREELQTDTLRRACGLVVKRLGNVGITKLALEIDESLSKSCPLDDVAKIIVEASILADYRFHRFKANRTSDQYQIESLTLCVPPKSNLLFLKKIVLNTQQVCESANYAREIANLPGNIVYPKVLTKYARELASKYRLKCTVYGKPELTKKRFGGLLAVGSGSVNDPQLIILEYKGSKSSRAKPVALVGKAITFDSGGISIKPGDRMDEMKFDKCGGIAVLGAMRAIAETKVPLNVIAVIASAENMPAATSYRPGDIITSYPGIDKHGVTIEVLNTDAEGRIVLGDALAYAREQKPQAIIDFATLTGACVIALGSSAAGIIGNNDKLIEEFRVSGSRTGERVWPLPLWQDYKDKIRSDVADIKNTGGREGGTITAAAFLAKYVGDVPWVHLDIAGTAWTTIEKPYYREGGTGFGVRLVLDLFSRWNGSVGNL